MEILKFCENLFSGMLPFTLLTFCGVYLTFKGRFFQFRRFGESVRLIKRAFCSKEKSDGLTSFQAACTALSATVGTGNIAGVAGALSIGGAGAIFWMWLSAVMGMAVKFAEVGLAVIYREKGDSEYRGGPMYYIKNGLPKKFKVLGMGFAAAAIPAVFCTGNITQTNAAVLSIGEDFVTRLIWGLIFTASVALVAAGGISRIGIVTERVVPVMSVLYIALSIGIIVMNINSLPTAFKMILKGALSPRAVTGGAVGSVMTTVITGASRGVFSNEAGIGTSAMAHSAAYDAKADTQGLFGVFEVFVDTIVICTLTALTILCSGVNIDYGSVLSSELVSEALSVGYGSGAEVLLAVMMCVFAFSSIIGWAVYGDICTTFLFGNKGKRLFMFLYPLGCMVGALCDASLAWRLSALFNGIMLCINIPAILLLSNRVFKYERGKENV